MMIQSKYHDRGVVNIIVGHHRLPVCGILQPSGVCVDDGGGGGGGGGALFVQVAAEVHMSGGGRELIGAKS